MTKCLLFFAQDRIAFYPRINGT